MKRVKLLCAIAAICAIAAASSAFAKTPTGVVTIKNGKALLKRTIETGKYAQESQNPQVSFVVADEEQSEQNFQTLTKLEERAKEVEDQLKEIENRNAIPWWEPEDPNVGIEPGPGGSGGGSDNKPGPCDPVDWWIDPCGPVDPCGSCGCWDDCYIYCVQDCQRPCFPILHRILGGGFGKGCR